MMRWIVHGERIVYDSEWMQLALTDIEIPGGERFDHHVVRMPAQASGTVVHDPERGVLVLWRHRFATDTWGWEVPAGRIEPGESPVDAARRETLEETGWMPGTMRQLTTYHPLNGSSDATFHLFVAEGATLIGPPTDPAESERVEWLPLVQIRDEVRRGQVRDGLSLTALLWWLVHDNP